MGYWLIVINCFLTYYAAWFTSWNLEIVFVQKERKGRSVEAGNTQDHLTCSDTSPERAVNMLNLFYDWSLFMFVQLHSLDPLSHVIPLHPAEARWCCWEWCCCFQQEDLAPAFVVLSDVLPSRGGDYMDQALCQHLVCVVYIWKYISNFGSPFECKIDT